MHISSSAVITAANRVDTTSIRDLLQGVWGSPGHICAVYNDNQGTFQQTLRMLRYTLALLLNGMQEFLNYTDRLRKKH